MMKTRWTLLLLFGASLQLLLAPTEARPQDLSTGMALAVGQLKQLMETGGGLDQAQSIEALGQKLDGGIKLGFGDAMNLPLPG